MRPNPSHSGQAPWGELKLNRRGSISSIVKPETGQAKREEKTVRGMAPTDPSLEQTRHLMIGMLAEYARAVEIQQHHRNAGLHMYRAYGLANYAHSVLEKAQPALVARGCDLTDLL